MLFPGSFDPFTKGHLRIVQRALALADEVVVAIGDNARKEGLFSVDERRERVERAFADEPRVRVDVYHGLTADYARQVGAQAILRGVRSLRDYEYEQSMADVNRSLTGIETVLLVAEPEYTALSSSLVRELLAYGKDVSALLP